MKDPFLQLTRGAVAIIVQTNLADGYHPGAAGQLAQVEEDIRTPGIGLVGMHSNSSVDLRSRFGQINGVAAGIQVNARIKDALHTGFTAPGQNLVTIFVKAVEIQVAVGIRKHLFQPCDPETIVEDILDTILVGGFSVHTNDWLRTGKANEEPAAIL